MPKAKKPLGYRELCRKLGKCLRKFKGPSAPAKERKPKVAKGKPKH